MKTTILAFIGIIIFIIIILNTNLSVLLENFSKMRLDFLALAIIINAVALFYKALKWKTVIKAHNSDYPLLNAIWVFCIGAFVGSITPARLGDFIRASYLKGSFGKALSTVIIDRIIDVAILIFFAVVAIVFFSYTYGVEILSWFLLLLLVLGFVVLVYLFSKEKYLWFARPLFNIFIPEKYKSKVRREYKNFYTAFRSVNISLLLLAILSGFLIWIITIFFGFVLAYSLGIKTSIFFMAMVIPILALLDMLPISISGIGTRDAATIFIFSFIGVAMENALAFSISILVFGYWMIAFIGWLFFLKSPLKYK